MDISSTSARIGLGAAALVLAGATFGGAGVAAADSPSTSAASRAATCEGWKTITLPGAKVEYKECHRTHAGKRQSSVSLYVWDKIYAAEPRARVVIGAWEATYTHFNPHAPNIPRSPKYDTGWHNGSDAKVTLSIKVD
ncbi:hypothetical protein [Streptomyces griseocarneus]|uniref:hypothetical protein n=1 Tax=Streptomyces griseocarneus TaxID=51201 RepID=UPI00167E0AE1|nr:hypothetical protein [Streptomyces griseocarneus]MBZ6477956.1 hypothetical protein [Streptomyces griseocarneus]GHG54475.1 hypothetical protein GCM10018779_17490 [Streptomyces griseocarneus]